MMDVKNRLKIRFLRPNEVGRLARLIRHLQDYQKMKGVSEIPGEDACREDLLHRDEQGVMIANNKNTFVAVAVDKSIAEEDNPEQTYIVGYLIYTQSFFISHNRQMYINSFYIDDGYRRHGIGTMFMRFFRLHARLLGNDRFDVPFMKDNYVGQKFYEKMGAYAVDDQYQLFMIDV